MSRRGLLISIAALFLGWEIVALLARTPLLPTVDAVLVALARGAGGGLGLHFAVSAWRVLASLVLTILLAAPAGLAIGLSPKWNDRLAGLIYLTYPMPKVVLLPILMLFLGIGDLPKIVLIWMILSYQVLLVVRDAAVGVHPDLIQSVASLGGTRWQLVRFVYVPACLPAVLTSLRVSIGTAIAVLFLAESIATTSGLGYYIMVEGWGRLAYADMYAGVVAMSLLGLALYVALDRLELLLCPWVAARREARVSS
jgi:ABC-type nitrate/sulfonate/bicarbonate transport system permease component